MKTSIFLKISFSLIILGIFLIVIFIALVYQQLNFQSYLIILLLLIFTFLFSFAISQRFVFPIKKLIRRASKLSEGSLKTRIYLETKDEFEQLANIFNQIAEELEKSHSLVEKTKYTVNIKIRAKTKELENVIESLEQKLKDKAREFQGMADRFEEFRKLEKEQELEIIELKKALQRAQDEIKKLKRKLK